MPVDRSRNPLARRAVAIVCAGTLIGVVGAGCAAAPGAVAPPSRPSLGGDQPNIVVVMTDDQSLHSFTREAMPETFRLLVDGGVRFTNAVVSPPICCPSRAGFLTGQYPHNHGIFANNPGYPDLRQPDRVLPAWMQAAGYRTDFVGKYLNRTVSELGGEPVPGWDHFFVLEHLQYFGESAYDDGERVKLGADTFTPQALNDRAVEAVESAAGEDPFFLWLATTSPHYRHDETSVCPGRSPKAASAADHRLFRNARLPRSPSFNEADVSDKPSSMRKHPLDHQDVREIERGFRCTLASLQEVDRGVARLWDALEATGEADDTVFVFTSDNGLFFGEHRLSPSKGRAYEEAIRVPLAIRLPAGPTSNKREETVDEVVSNQDLTATLLALAGAQPCVPGVGCRTLDGASAAGLLEGDAASWPRDHGILLEQGTDGCNYAAIRTQDYLFNQLLRPGKDGCEEIGRELYDLRRDPLELHNKVHDSRADRELRKRLNALRHCSGRQGPSACE